MKTFKTPIFLGTTFFLFQLFLIIFLATSPLGLAPRGPEKNIYQAWLSLASHWDSVWFESIASQGYVKPSNWNIWTTNVHQNLWISNVAFFPGYPYLARILILLFNINAKAALLIVAQSAALCFWCLFFHIIKNISFKKQIYAAILIMCFPSSWFLFMGYSESIFILMGCLLLFFATQNKWLLSGISGAAMIATRLAGIPLLIVPLLSKLIINFSDIKSQIQNKHFYQILKKLFPQSMIAILSSFGILAFFIYCQLKFNWWNLFFDMRMAGWKQHGDPLFLFKRPTWLPPPFGGYPIEWAPPLDVPYANLFVFKFFKYAAYTFSETLVPLFMWLIIICSFILLKKRKEINEKTLTWFLGATLVFLFSCMSLIGGFYEGMTRVLLPVWIFLIIADAIAPKHIFFFRFTKNLGFKVLVIMMILISSGFWLQLINRWYLNWWVS